jgi:hypothetical protein
MEICNVNGSGCASAIRSRHRRADGRQHGPRAAAARARRVSMCAGAAGMAMVLETL